MDPNANLAEQRRIIAKILAEPGFLAKVGLCNDLAELAQALDGWISAGGFLPDAWAVAFTTRTTYAQRTGRNVRAESVTTWEENHDHTGEDWARILKKPKP